jgi:hypothetical protein
MGQIRESGCSSWSFQLGLMFAPFTPCSLLALLTNSISGLKGFLPFRNIRKLWVLKVLSPGNNFLYHFLAWGVQPIAPDIKHNTICITTATKSSFGFKKFSPAYETDRESKIPNNILHSAASSLHSILRNPQCLLLSMVFKIYLHHWQISKQECFIMWQD